MSGISGQDHTIPTIVHLDSTAFFGRMPDRSQLHDHDETVKAIKEETRQLQRQQLEKLKSQITAEEFAHQFWSAAYSLSMLDVMNDVPVIPASQVSLLDEPRTEADWEDDRRIDFGSAITKEMAESGKYTFIELSSGDLSSIGGGEKVQNWQRLMYAYAREWILLDGLPSGHWGDQYTISLCDWATSANSRPPEVSVAFVERSRTETEVWGNTIKLVDCEYVKMALTGHELIDVPYALVHKDSEDNLLLLVPQRRTYIDFELRQISSFTHNDFYDETEFDDCCTKVNALLQSLRDNDKSNVVKTMMFNLPSLPLIAGKSFAISFDEFGAIRTVDEIKAA